jgi:ATP-binding cassette subfamily B protein
VPVYASEQGPVFHQGIGLKVRNILSLMSHAEAGGQNGVKSNTLGGRPFRMQAPSMAGKTFRMNTSVSMVVAICDSMINCPARCGAMTDFEKSPLRIFASYYRLHWKLFVGDMFAASLIALVDLAFPMLAKHAIERFLPNGMYRLFFVMVALMAFMYLLRMGFAYFIAYWGHTVGVYLEADMRRDLFSHLQRLPFSFYDNHRTGQIMSRVTTDLFDVTELAHHGPEDLFISIVTLTGAVVLVASIRWEMALALLVFVPFMLFHILRSRSNMIKAARKVKERTAEINADLESSISGVRVA